MSFTSRTLKAKKAKFKSFLSSSSHRHRLIVEHGPHPRPPRRSDQIPNLRLPRERRPSQVDRVTRFVTRSGRIFKEQNA